MKTISLGRGRSALVDDSDYDAVMAAGPWFAFRPKGRSVFYARRNTFRGDRRTTEYLHRFIFGAPGVDHVNGDGLDNRRSNLRACTASTNGANRGLQRNSTTGFKGVTLKRNKGRDRWQARIQVAGRWLTLGRFDTPEDAGRAYDRAAVQHFGEFARLNFPEEPAA